MHGVGDEDDTDGREEQQQDADASHVVRVAARDVCMQWDAFEQIGARAGDYAADALHEDVQRNHSVKQLHRVGVWRANGAGE